METEASVNVLSQQDIKRSGIGTLRIFRDFCEKNKLRYYLAFGTLLGAVRHKGFIPWDDDIDIFMPRPDYDYLLRHFNDADTDRREVISRQSVPDFYLNIAKIIDRNTVLIEEDQTLPIGVWIDVFPMDFMPETYMKRLWTMCYVYCLNFFISYSGLTYRRGRIWYKNFIIMLFKCICPPKYLLDILYKNEIMKLGKNTSGHYYGLLYRYFGISCVPIIHVSFFEPSVKLEFEGEMYDVPKKYDELLKACYGNYMKFPPIELRKNHHSYVCYWNKNCLKENK